MRTRNLARVLHSYWAAKCWEADENTTEIRKRFVQAIARDVRADTWQASSYQHYIHSEPTIHSPRPPERRVTAKAVARRSFLPPSAATGINEQQAAVGLATKN